MNDNTPRTRQELVNQVAGLLSTIEFVPAERHPIAMDAYADQVVSLVVEWVNGADNE